MIEPTKNKGTPCNEPGCKTVMTDHNIVRTDMGEIARCDEHGGLPALSEDVKALGAKITFGAQNG